MDKGIVWHGRPVFPGSSLTPAAVGSTLGPYV
jgi:hypothetical protein